MKSCCATTELHRRHRNHAADFHITARRLAEFLESVEAEEVVLTQRLRDSENRAVRLGIVARDQNADAQPEQPSPAQAAEHLAAYMDEETVGQLYGAF